MDASEIANRADALKAELAAKSSRIADLEARVSFLEGENESLRKAMPKGEEMENTGKICPAFGRLEEGFAGNKEKSVDLVGGGHMVCDVTEVSDGEEEDVLTVVTPKNFAARVVTGKSEDEDEIKDTEGSGGGNHGSVCSDDSVDLEDDDVSTMPRGKKRAAALVVTSDSEDEDGNGGHVNDKDSKVQKEVGVTPSRKRALCGVSDSENEDGDEGVYVVNGNDVESGEIKGSSTPAARRSTRLAKRKSKGVLPARRALVFVEPKDGEDSEDDSEEDNSMDEFIDDAEEDNSSETAVDSAEASSAGSEESDSEPNYRDVLASIRRKRNVKDKDWESEQEMLSAFDEHPELCLKAVCALYRKQTEEEQMEKATIVHNKRGFNQIDAPRGSRIAQFLLDGDASGPLMKTTHDLEKYDRYGLEFCRKMAFRYSKQLFAIYHNKEDPDFP